MKIFLVPVGIMKKYMKELELEIDETLTPKGLMGKYIFPDKLKTVYFVNGKRTDPNSILKDGDVVKIVSTFAGG